MISYELEPLATSENFDENSYLAANPDVAQAVKNRDFNSGRQHFEIYGKAEGRRISRDASIIAQAKRRKKARIRPLLQDGLAYVENEMGYDFLSQALQEEFNIVDTNAVSSHGYDEHGVSLIHRHENDLLLDFGAGKRPIYYENVVNFEIVAYPTTDVRGVGEHLPFKDNSFEGVICIAVLEHVKDPFRCAREISRVLKPNGELICAVPFLQPFHAYPHHYYNMTHQGLKNLFESSLQIDRVEVLESVLPIWSLTWILQSWAAGLSGKTKRDFLDMKVSDLIGSPSTYLKQPFVRELSSEKNFELASACVLFAHK